MSCFLMKSNFRGQDSDKSMLISQISWENDGKCFSTFEKLRKNMGKLLLVLNLFLSEK